jgi:hypothetical protein
MISAPCCAAVPASVRNICQVQIVNATCRCLAELRALILAMGLKESPTVVPSTLSTFRHLVLHFYEVEEAIRCNSVLC